MADIKISALPTATTPLAGTEVLPIVQGGVTDQVTVANLTAGRAVSATQITLSTGDVILSTAAKGVSFAANTPAAGMTSQLLNWYEEGTWTPTITGSSTAGTASYTTQTGAYTKIGRQVTVTCRLTWSAANGTGVMQISGLPFTTTTITNQVAQIMPISMAAGDVTYVMGYVAGSVTKIQLYKYAAGVASSLSVEASGDLIMTMTYTAA